MIINHILHIQDRFGNLFFIFLQSFKLFVTVIVVIYMILKELLSQYEIENNLSHKEMAQLLNVSTSTYYRWLSGESTKLKKITINKLSEIFDCDIEGVLEETNRLKPILGKVKAGYDLWADQDVEGYLEVGKGDAVPMLPNRVLKLTIITDVILILMPISVGILISILFTMVILPILYIQIQQHK